MKSVINLCLVIFLSGCASVPKNAPPYTPAPSASAGSGTLYIYREGAYPLKRTPDVYIDGELLFEPPETAYTWLHLKEGMHKLVLDWWGDTGAPDLELEFEITNREEHYLKITGSFSGGYNSMTFGSSLRFLDKDTAESDLKYCCKYIENKVNKTLKSDAKKSAH